MHIPDGLVDLPTSAGAAAVAAPAVALATRRAGRQLTERQVPVAGLVVAYLLVAQLLVFPVGLGTGAHLLGAGLALVLAGPWVAQACVAVVLVVQTLVLADGGITALGLNDLNNGTVPVLVGWAVLAATRRWWTGPDRTGAAPAAAALAAGAGTFAAGGALCVELALGAGGALATTALTAGVLGAHAVMAIVEGLLTGLLIAALGRTRPDLVLPWWRAPTRPAPPPDPGRQERAA